MKIIYTIIGVLISIFASPNVYAQEIKLAYQKKFDHKSGILNINNVTSHGNLYVIGDFKAKKVYVLNSTFELVTEFVSEKCHPGSAFNPGKITKVDEDHVLITSQPVPTYMLNIKSMDCSTRLGQESRFIPAAHMSSTGNGVLLNITLNKSSILSIENYVYYLNQFDFKVIRFSKRDLISGIVNPTQITIPIMIAHVDERQMITTSYNVDDESTILRKYNIIY